MARKTKDLIAEERSASAPDPAWPFARIIRWELLHGAQLTQHEINDRGGSPTLLSTTGKALKEAGFTVRKARNPGNTITVSVMGNGARPRQPRQAYRAPEPEPVAVPPLGSMVTVVMTAVTEDGYGICIRAADGQEWLAHIDR